MADDVLYSGVRGVTDLMVMPGLINLDFADIRSVMSEMGKAMMGTGEAEGERRAIDAAEAAIANPLLDDTSMSGAKGVLINITAGKDITLFEVDEAANRIRDEVEESANIIFGSTFEESLEGSIRVSVVATGIEAVAGVRTKPILHKVTGMSEEPASISAPVGVIGALEQPATQQLIELENTEEKAVVLPGKKGNEPNLSTQNELIEYHDEPKKETTETTETTEQTETVCGTSTDGVFIPAPPVEGELGLKSSANPFAVADMINAGVEKTQNKAPKKKGISLIERVTRVTLGDRRSASKNQISRIEPEIKEHSEKTSVQVLNQLNGEPEKRLKDEPSTSKPEKETPIEKELGEIGKDLEQIFDTTSKFEPKTLSEQAEAGVVEQKQESESELEHEVPTLLKRVNANDGLSVNEEDADLLEIPAFLRRQAN
jgi:cell division protein FtsZ